MSDRPDTMEPGLHRTAARSARNRAANSALAGRTLTALYNARPRWLADAHAALDAAVAAAYGWDADVSGEDALRGLLALNTAGGSE